MSRNLPCRVTSSTSVPSSAESGGSKVFSALNAATCDLDDGAVGEPAPEVEGQGFHLGQLGHAHECRGRRRPRQASSCRGPVLLLQPLVLRVGGGAVPGGLEDRGGGRLLLVDLLGARQLRAAVRPAAAALLGGDRAVVLAAAAVVGVAPGPGVAHLQELAGHVGAHEVALGEVAGERLLEGRAAAGGLLDRGELPQRQQLGLVGLHLQHALLAAADGVELGVGAQVEGS